MLVQRYLRVAEADHAEIAGGEIRAGPPPGVPGLVLPRGKQYAKGAGHLRIIELSVMRIMSLTAPSGRSPLANLPQAITTPRRNGDCLHPTRTRAHRAAADVLDLIASPDYPLGAFVGFGQRSCPRKDPLGLRRRCSLYRHECIAEFIPALLSPWGRIPPSPPDHLCLSQEADFCGAHDDIRGTARKHRRWLAKCLLD